MQTINATSLFKVNEQIQEENCKIILNHNLVNIISDFYDIKLNKEALKLSLTSILIEDQKLGNIQVELTPIQMKQLLGFVNKGDNLLQQILVVLEDQNFPDLVQKVEQAIMQSNLM